MNKKEKEILKLLKKAEELEIINLINCAALTNPFNYSEEFIITIENNYWDNVEQYFNI